MNGKKPRAQSCGNKRIVFKTSRSLDFSSEKELTAQIGHKKEHWPAVVVKELVDNALDACEEAGVPPQITVTVEPTKIVVEDNGPGIPPETVGGVIDFDVRMSSREAYAAPDRGAQGNALKTVVNMPFVLDEQSGSVLIETRGESHRLRVSADRVRQRPVVDHERKPSAVRIGTRVEVVWPNSARLILEEARPRIVQIVDGFGWLNPHAAIRANVLGTALSHDPVAPPTWSKWSSHDPTSAHWYSLEHFERLIAAHVTHDRDRGDDRTVRDFVSQFEGLARSAKQKEVLDATRLVRVSLSALADDRNIRSDRAGNLLDAMKRSTKPVKPARLGIIGEELLRRRYEAAGADLDSFQYARRADSNADGVPCVLEVAFGWVPDGTARRRDVAGVNWSPALSGIPFRELGSSGINADAFLAQAHVSSYDPVIVFIHYVSPVVRFLDRGKASVVLDDAEHDESEALDGDE